MKKLIIMIITVSITLMLANCVKKLDKYGFVDTTTLKGKVIEESTQSPVPEVNVSVTNGSYTYSSTATDSNGRFEINVDFSKIATDYYLLFDGGTEGKKRQHELKGMGQEMFDYKTIILYNKTITDAVNVKTKDINSITAISAVCNAEVVIGTDVRLISKGVCWSETENPTIANDHTDDGNQSGSYSSNIIGLTEHKTYYIRAYAKTNDNVYYGEQLHFITPAMFPSILYNGRTYYIYDDVEPLNWSSAMSFCENLTAGGFDDWFLPNEDELNALYINRDIIGNFTNNKYWSSSEIESSKSYYRTFANNGALGSDYKSNAFKVRPVRTGENAYSLPSVITGNVSFPSGGSAQLNGNLTASGGLYIYEYGFCYGSSPNPTINDNIIKVGSGTSIGLFNKTLDELQIMAEYHVRAYAKNYMGIAYGEDVSFTVPIPTFQYNGHTYQVAPDPDSRYSWNNAIIYCDNLTLYGFSDWSLPTKDELSCMYVNRYAIGGFTYEYNGYGDCCYWSSTPAQAVNSYYLVSFDDGDIFAEYYYMSNRIRPIRRVN
ncbi:MAG: hypothetical protein CW336_02985 [Bacteroidetes bacterium]|nr:hypothetical protein [Bacteroidota bacterium]